MSHTPEPWVRHTGYVLDKAVVYITSDAGSIASMDGYAMPLRLANASRAVACVNALAGVEDPAAEIERLRAFVGSEMLRSDFRTAAEMRAEIRQLRSDRDVLAANLRAWRKWGSVEVGEYAGCEELERDRADKATDASGALTRAGGGA
jgi:hypothetical protein